MPMDSEMKTLLEENLKLARENNAMLRKMRNLQKWAKIWAVTKYVFWIGLAFGAYKFLEPYLENLNGALKSISQFTNVF